MFGSSVQPGKLKKTHRICLMLFILDLKAFKLSFKPFCNKFHAEDAEYPRARFPISVRASRTKCIKKPREWIKTVLLALEIDQELPHSSGMHVQNSLNSLKPVKRSTRCDKQQDTLKEKYNWLWICFASAKGVKYQKKQQHLIKLLTEVLHQIFHQLHDTNTCCEKQRSSLWHN